MKRWIHASKLIMCSYEIIKDNYGKYYVQDTQTNEIIGTFHNTWEAAYDIIDPDSSWEKEFHMKCLNEFDIFAKDMIESDKHYMYSSENRLCTTNRNLLDKLITEYNLEEPDGHLELSQLKYGNTNWYLAT